MCFHAICILPIPAFSNLMYWRSFSCMTSASIILPGCPMSQISHHHAPEPLACCKEIKISSRIWNPHDQVNDNSHQSIRGLSPDRLPPRFHEYAMTALTANKVQSVYQEAGYGPYKHIASIPVRPKEGYTGRGARFFLENPSPWPHFSNTCPNGNGWHKGCHYQENEKRTGLAPAPAAKPHPISLPSFPGSCPSAIQYVGGEITRNTMAALMTVIPSSGNIPPRPAVTQPPAPVRDRNTCSTRTDLRISR